ncbi:MAG: poly-beta-1,6 N-acetyl-D-glucosamine synthase [Synechococcaceae bacterium WB5_2B_268]|nr:poly-beta-1,6 N-acetyl-D-glucosamine synthase [Synechococcaceae bacterium WB5_2B_268]
MGALGGFLFGYPLVMAFVWMLLALGFLLRREWPDRGRSSPPPGIPFPVSILIPCYNEAANLADTIRYALESAWPQFELIAINDGSSDDTGRLLEQWAARDPRVRVVHLAKNQGKAMALQAGALLARHELMVCIDGDALLDAQAVAWLVRRFQADPGLGAVTGNPRIRNRTSLLGRIQVGEFSSIIGLIKRAQSMLGGLFTVSGVITAFRRSALHEVGYWSVDMLTEDIAITWALQRAGWRVAYEPQALVWILMPETLRGLWKQRLRWAEGGIQVLLANANLLVQPRQWRLLPLAWLGQHLGLLGGGNPLAMPLLPSSSGLWLGATCLLQFGFSLWLDRPYDRRLGRNFYWMIWYPIAFWVLTMATSVVALPMVLRRRRGLRARWVSPDRGFGIGSAKP